MSDFGTPIFREARKQHKCVWCGQEIPVGEKYWHFTGMWEDEFQNWRMHEECFDAANDTELLQEGFTPYSYARGTQEDR